MSSDANDPQAELIQAVRAGHHALENLIQLNRPWLARQAGQLFDHHPAARGLNAELGEDGLVQETLLRAARHLHSFRGISTASFRAWLRAILRRTFQLWLDRVQAARRDFRREDQTGNGSQSPSRTAAYIDPGPTPSSQLRRRENWEQFLERLNHLPLRHRVALLLSAEHLMTDAQIGWILGCSENAAQLTRARGVQMLRDTQE